MDVIAHIPALSTACLAKAGDVATAVSRPSTAEGGPRPEPPEPIASAMDRNRRVMPSDEAPVTDESGAGRNRRRARTATTLFSPSVIALSVVAVAVWAAALRNDRLRAIEQQRPQRVAWEPPASAGPERSRTP